jgi:hypothetical protein
MAVQIVPVSPRPNVRFKDRTGNDATGLALAFVWSDADQNITAWIVARDPRFEGTTEQVDAGQVQRFENM